MSGDEQRRIAAAAHVRIYGDIWVVDQREGPSPVDAFSLNEREPNPFEWLLSRRHRAAALDRLDARSRG